VDERTTARPAAPRARLPEEPVSVVRPEVGAYGPAAAIQARPTAIGARPVHGMRDDLDPYPVLAVDVEIDDTDHGAPVAVPRGPAATDDMPLPSPEDVFGGIEILGEDPLDAPQLQGTAPLTLPSPVRPGGGARTAVPSTDPGFDAISLDDPESDGGFFAGPSVAPNRADTDAGAMEGPVEAVAEAPRRQKSPIERVAEGAVALNAVLAVAWLAVRVL
jgi:hypothetical protein